MPSYSLGQALRGRDKSPHQSGFVEFVDEHWVAAIVLAAPLLLPLLAEIRKFVSKVVRVKYDKLELSVDVVQEETRKKPQRELAK